MAPIEFAESSLKHSVPESDQRHAIANAVVAQLVEPDVVLIIGRPHAQSRQWLELLIRTLPNGDKRVFHAIELGPKFRPFLEGKE